LFKDIDVLVSGDLDVCVYGDFDLFMMVVCNLVDNVVVYFDGGMCVVVVVMYG